MILQEENNMMIGAVIGLLCIASIIVIVTALFIELEHISRKCKRNIDRIEKISDFAEETDLSPSELLALYDIIRE